MYHSIQLTSTIPIIRTLNRHRFGQHFLLTLWMFVACALLPAVRAVTPPPDGGYPNQNTAEGDSALFSLTTGTSNTVVGYHGLFSDTTGYFNTATGAFALANNTTGIQNTATGGLALYSNTYGYGDTATGLDALYSNTSGNFNTATGYDALSNNTSGYSNTATGSSALSNNTFGSQNTADGLNALYSNTTGVKNTATGVAALYSNTTGIQNTAMGEEALLSNTTGGYNAASGQGALYSNTTGRNNTACGQNALRGNTIGNNNIALGSNAGINVTSGSNNIEIFDRGGAGDTNTIRIGKAGAQTTTYIAGISGATVAGGVGVIVDSDGHLGTVTSSERFKDQVKPMDKASEAILSLQPVTFRYKKELDPHGIPQFGLVAEQVEKINPDLVARDDQGKPYTVRYEAVNAMLLNEFLKAHRRSEEQEHKVQQQDATIAALQSQVRALSARLDEQATQIQKVSAPAQLVEGAPGVAVNNR